MRFTRLLGLVVVFVGAILLAGVILLVASSQTTTPPANPSAGVGGTGAAVNVPVITEAFSLSPVDNGQSTTLTITIKNPSSQQIEGVQFNDTLSTNGGIIITDPNNLTSIPANCGGSITAVAGDKNLFLNDGVLAGGETCTIVVTVAGVLPGTYINSTGPVTATNAPPGTAATASLTVNAGSGGALTVSDLFVTNPPTNPASIAAGGIATLQFTLTNPANFNQFGATFTNNLPSTASGAPGNLVVAPNANVTQKPSGCLGGGAIIAAPGTGIITVKDAYIVPGAPCVVSVDVTTATAGTYKNTTNAPASKNVPNGGVPSNPATLSVTGPSLTVTPGVTPQATNPATAKVTGTF